MQFIKRACSYEYKLKKKARSYQVDWVLDTHKETIKNLFYLLEVDTGVENIKRQTLIKLFEDFFPYYKKEIRQSSIQSQVIINDSSEKIGNVHYFEVQDFYEFLVRLSLLVVDEDVPPFICLDITLKYIKNKLLQSRVLHRQ